MYKYYEDKGETIVVKKGVVFVILTSYQMMVADVYAYYINEIYPDKEITFIIIGDDLKPRISKQCCKTIRIRNLNDSKMHRVWQRMYYGGNLFYFTILRKELKKYDSLHTFLFNDNEPISNRIMRYTKRIRGQVTVIEEGVAMYTVTSHKKRNIKEQMRLLFTLLLGSPMQYRAIADCELVDSVIVSNPTLYNELEKSKGKKIYSQDKADIFYKTATAMEADNMFNRKNERRIEILYLGQELNGYGTLSINEKEYLDRLFTLLSKYIVLIKPHPRDRDDKYDCFEKYHNVCIMKGEIAKIPVECIASMLKVSIVVSDNSSAGMNLANTFKNCVCIYLRKMYDSPNENIIRKHALRNEKAYVGIYDNVFFPDSETELLQLIVEHKDNLLKKKDSNNSHINQYEISRLLGKQS